MKSFAIVTLPCESAFLQVS